MQYPVRVAVIDCSKKLDGQCFDFRLEEGIWHEAKQGLEIVFNKVHDDENPAMIVRYAVRKSLERSLLSQSIAHDHLPNPHNILMSAGHERIDLSQGGDRKPMFFLVQFQFLQSHDITCLLVFGPKHNTV
jgi:hypothetical protein